MSAVQKIPTAPDDATLELWRVAETGDVRQLAPVLERARDINAQNEHGVTALMRAAQFGHVKMVRALLDHGADANVRRNDKFTALALAAFFGHTDIVRALMEHGADLQASTRHDTSPHMWATARTFNEVVNQLEKPAPVHQQPLPVQQPAATVQRPLPVQKTAPSPRPAPVQKAEPPRPEVAAAAPVVRTLKDPPEIWDLVHEAPRGFNPRSAFLTRLQSAKTSLAFRLAALAVLIGAGVVGVMVLRGVQARDEGSAAVKAKPPAAATMSLQTTDSAAAATQNNTPPAAVNTTSSVSPLPPLPSAEGEVSAGEQPAVYRKPGGRSRFGSQRGLPSAAPQVATGEASQPVAAAPPKPNPEPRVEPKAKENSALSPQMIAPAKTATPKGKVIQWP